MTSENNIAPEPKINKGSDAENLLKWPPPDYKDTFSPPRHYKVILTNHLKEAICMLNSAESFEKANDPAVPLPEKEIGVFFSHRLDEKAPKPDNPNHGDWMLFPMPDNPGSSKKLLIHRSTAKFIAETRRLYGDVRLIMHPVPHPTMHGVFAIAEIYILPSGVEGTDFKATQFCFFCKKRGALGTCKCESVNFCSGLCRERAVADRLHTEEQCTVAMRKPILGTLTDVRRFMNDYKLALDENKASAAQLTQQQAEKAAKDEKAAKELELTDVQKAEKRARILAEAKEEEEAKQRAALSEPTIIYPPPKPTVKK